MPTMIGAAAAGSTTTSTQPMTKEELIAAIQSPEGFFQRVKSV